MPIIRQTQVKVIEADITEMSCEAIVNPANNLLQMGGGLAGVIRKKGGVEIETEAIKKGPIEIGGATWSKAGKLKAQYVIHAATMGMDFQTDEHIIRNACTNALKVAEELKISSIALPALGCGVGNFPLISAAKIMTQVVLRHLADHPQTLLREINFCLYDQEAYDIFYKNVSGYLDYFTKNLNFGPYVTVDMIIEHPQGIVLIERLNPPFGWALPGGFVDRYETLEEAAIRESKEETGLDIQDLKQFHTYSDPKRDPRFHTISTAFIAKAQGTPKFGDDAKNVKLFKKEELLKLTYAFDHGTIIKDYLNKK